MYLKKGIIDRIEGETAVIKIEDGQTLNWETINLPPDLVEGDQVSVEIKDAKQGAQDQQALAREILNEVFNNVPQETSANT